MNLEKYDIETEVNSNYFEFISKGSQGSMVKVVKYTKIFEDQDIYNLGFGDKNLTTGELDDIWDFTLLSTKYHNHGGQKQRKANKYKV